MNINGILGLFPLQFVRNGFDGYYINAAGEVFSTKQYATPRKMTGGPGGRGTGRVYTFTSTDRFQRLPMNVRGDTLLADAKRHARWAIETNQYNNSAPLAANAGLVPMPAMNLTHAAAAKAASEKASRNHASSTADGIARKGYIIGRLDGDAIVFGSKPVIHTSLTSVKSEVERLVQANPGKTILYVKIEGAAVANGIHWA